MAWSKYALSDERDDSHSLMPAGMFFVVVGGWFLSRWTYFGVRLCEGLVGAFVQVESDF